MTVLRDADAAMYRGEGSGPGPDRAVQLSSFGSGPRGRLELESSLRHALDRGELRLAYQPIVSLSTGLTVGMESLLRWDRPDGDSVPPAGIHPVAEQCGLIALIGDWVIDEAVSQIMRWRRNLPGAEDLWVSVNLSSRQLAPAVVTICERALAKHDAPGAAISIEITESILMEDVEASIEVLRSLRALGHPGGNRRLRDRLLVSGVSEAPSAQGAEDRPLRSSMGSVSTRRTRRSSTPSSVSPAPWTSSLAPRESRPAVSFRS